MKQLMWDFKSFENHTAFIDDHGRMLSYGDLEYESEKLAELFEKKKRCLVFLLCENSIGSAFGYAALLNHGIVPVMLSCHLDQELLNNLISIYSPAFLWLPDEMRTSCSASKPLYSAYGYSLIRMNPEQEYPLHDELALLLTTSGSTGSPKFVRQSYKNIKANTESIVEYLAIDCTERPITTLPMNYTYGLSIINTHLYVGAAILLTEKSLMVKEFWDFFKGQGATSFAGVPFTYEMLDKLRFYRMELPSLRSMTQAGGKLASELHEKFAENAAQTGRKFVVMYGQCEATARMGYLPADKAVEKKGSMGIPIPGGTFRLIDVNGREITSPHTTGELIYEGDNVTLGYAECGDDLIRGDERGSVLATGDMAQFDEDGYYYIVGRKKRFLKIYGNRVNLDEMDRMIKAKFELDVTCAGIDDHMYIFLTEKQMEQEVRKYTIDMTGLNPSAFQTIVIEAIPRNDAGKVLYKELERYYV